MRPKIKLYRVEGYTTIGRQPIVWQRAFLADFEREAEAEKIAALLNKTDDLDSYQIGYGHGRFSRVYRSRRFTTCPKCTAQFRLYELPQNVTDKHVTCDSCGTNFAWSVRMDGSPGLELNGLPETTRVKVVA